MPSVDQQVEDRIQAFVAELSELVRRQALQAVAEVLGGGGARSNGARTRPARTGRQKAPAFGVRRTPEQLATAEKKLTAYVAAHPGLRIEEINAAIGTTTRELRRPLTKLVRSGVLRRKGVKRAARYFPGRKAAA